MPTVTQIFLLLCLRGTAAVSTDGGGVPALIRDFFGFGPVYEQSRFTPLSFQAAEQLVHHNGSIERGQGPCYDPGYSCNGAACCDNGSCAGTDQTCCGDGICDAGYGCCENKGCVLLADTCCDDGGYCPAGQGCFSYDNSNQIFCSPTGGGTHPATSTVKPESTPSSINQPTSIMSASSSASSSVYYYTYEYEWTTFYYIYEIESFTTYIVTTVLSAVATDAAAASSSFNAFTATFVPTAPPTSLPGASTPSPSSTASTVPASTSSASRSTSATSSSTSSSTSTSAASHSGAESSANIRRETLSAMYTVGIVMVMMIII